MQNLMLCMYPTFPKPSLDTNKDCLIIIRTLFLLSLFAVNFNAFNSELEEVWGHFWIALEMSYSKMPSNFSWLKIKGMKIDRKKRQQNKCPDNYGTVLTYFSIILLFFRNININIDINIPFFSISISRSRFWTWRFQDQDQYRYFGKPEFNIKIKINMTNILKNIGKSIYCPIPVWHMHTS